MAGDRKEYHALYRLQNKERLTKKQNERREKNKDIIKYRRHLAYEAEKEKRLKRQHQYLEKKRSYLQFDYPFIEEGRKKIKTERGKYEYDKNWKKWKDSMYQHHLNRRKKHLEHNRKRRNHEKMKRIQKRKDENQIE